jgi:hypothetical protein
MITITIGKEEVRTAGQYQSNRYKVEVVQEVDSPEKIDETMNKTFATIRKQLYEQKKMDGEKA